MADKKISDLTDLAVTPAIDDVLPIVDTSATTTKKITWSNLQGFLDHDLLTGFIANEHINHTGVSITAGAGLSGGGTIATDRTLAVDIASLNTVTPAVGDYLMFADITDSNAIRKTTPTALSPYIDHDTLLNFTADEHFTQANITTVGTVTTGTWNATPVVGQYGGTGVANIGKTITLGGNITTAGAFITSGAFSTTLTSTAATNVTLPTTGTLATLAGSESLTNKSLTSPKIVTSLVFDQAQDTTIIATSPSAERQYTIPDVGADTSFVMAAGAQTIAGVKTFSSFGVTPSSAPTSDYQWANKKYVDDNVAGQTTHEACRLATTTTLPACTYNNGTGGVGATLTGDAVGQLADIDSVTPVATNRILVKDQADAEENGVYTVTTLGDGGNAFVLTRVTDFDAASSSEIVNGATFFITAGTANGNESWSLTTSGTITVGTTELAFTQTGGSTAYTSGDGIDINAGVISTDIKLNDGLKIDATELTVAYDNSTIGIVSNLLAVKSTGIKNTHIDFTTIYLDDIQDGTNYQRIQTADITSNRITALGTLNSQLNISYDTGGTEDPADAVIKVVQASGSSSQDDYAFAYYDSGTPAVLLSSLTFIGDMTLSGQSQFYNNEDDSTEGGASNINPLSLACTSTGELTYADSLRAPLHLQNKGTGYGGDGTGEYFLTARKADTGALDWYVSNLNVMYLNGNLGLGVVPTERLHVKNSTTDSSPAFLIENDAQKYKLVVDGSDSDKLKLQDTSDSNANIMTVTKGTQDISFIGDLNLATGKDITVNGANRSESIILTAKGGTPSTTSGCSAATLVEFGTTAANRVNEYVTDFDKDSIEYEEWTVKLPDKYEDGTTLTAIFEFTYSTGSTGQAVVWGIQGISYANGDPISASWGTGVEVTTSVTAANVTYVSSATGAITLAGTPVGKQTARFRVYRNATAGGDTLAGDARLINVYVKYSVDSMTE